DDRVSHETAFVQAAILELLGPRRFDQVVVVATPTSVAKHYTEFEKTLGDLGVRDLLRLDISEELDAAAQWDCFEKILGVMGHGDSLTVDVTHGYRLFPVVISSALHFLRVSKGVSIDAVLYGAWEKDRERSPVIDMKDFYVIGDYADAVSSLVENADAGKLARVAAGASGLHAGELGDPEVTKALNDLTGALRNVEVNLVREKAGRALALLAEKRRGASVTSSLLLNLVVEKFVALAREGTEGGLYSTGYFEVQIAMARLLLEHRLFMQAFTVMREFVVSLADRAARRVLGDDSSLSADKKKHYLKNSRRMLAEPLAGIVMSGGNLIPHENDPGGVKFEKYMRPYHGALAETGLDGKLSAVLNGLKKYRNGFNHAWTSGKGVPDDFMEKGESFLADLESVYGELVKRGLA
ncbi:MAG TPA: TIGR02221 family CRISPR-associated protein, partial [Spirochaetota bacterium]|nr:TIGR02221 family CRISPR-associated protein [Spirochaetota bacterium]